MDTDETSSYLCSSVPHPWLNFFLMLGLFSITLLPGSARAQTDWQLTTTDFHRQPISLRAISPTGLEFVDSTGKTQQLPFSQFLDVRRATHAAATKSPFVLHLRDGDELTGEPTKMTQNNLDWHSAGLSEISIPLQQIASIRRPGDAANLPSATEDVVHLSNGDVVHGILASINAQSLSIQTQTAAPSVPLSAVARIDLATVGLPTTKPSAPALRIGLSDGSQLTISSLNFTAGEMTFAYQSQPHHLKASQVISIEQINGPVIFLADRPPTSSVQVPFMGQPWPARLNQGVTGNPMASAISVRAFSKLTWLLDGSHRTFRSRYIVPPDRPLADITVRVQLDGKTVYEKSHIRGGSDSGVLNIPLNQAHRLTLEVDTADPYRAQGALTWINPALVK